MTALALFAATFAVVFLLGLQQINVERRSIVAAALTSPLIGLATLVQFKVLPGPTDAADLLGYLLGGAAGIAAAVWLHPAMARRMWLLSVWCKRHGLARKHARAPRAPTTATPSPDLRSYPPKSPPLTPDDHAQRLVDTLRLATSIADETARVDLDSYCHADIRSGVLWRDTRLTAPLGREDCADELADMQLRVDTAVRYLELRGQLTRHPAEPHLVRAAS